MIPEGFGINYDLLRGLPESKSAWAIWLGDHYNQKNLNINQIIVLLMQKYSDEIQDGADPVDTYKEYSNIWNQFVKGSEFGDEMLFENNMFRAIPELAEAVKRERIA